jgi:hypothetical protein
LEGVEGVDTGGVDAVDVDPDGARDGRDDETEYFPFMWPPVAVTDPKDFTLSDLMAGIAVGEVEIGAETSPIDPKVTAVPNKMGFQSVVMSNVNAEVIGYTDLASLTPHCRAVC